MPFNRTPLDSIDACVDDILHNQPHNTNVTYYCPECGEDKGKLSLKFDSNSASVIGRCWRAACDVRVYRKLEGIQWAQHYNQDSNAPARRYSTELPKDWVQSIPKAYEHWLQLNRVTQQLVNQYRIGYSYTLQRLVIPSPHDLIEGYYARSNTKTPKWINKVTLDCFPATKQRYDKPLVLVEDPISAMRVSDVCDCMALCGTKTYKNSLDFIGLKYYSMVILWLDSDLAGMRGVLYNVPNIRTWFPQTPIRSITTDHDPKGYTTERIAYEIQNAQV